MSNQAADVLRESLWTVALAQRGNARRYALRVLKSHATTIGLPFGVVAAGNSKTRLTGTTRAFSTCPLDCEHGPNGDASCYALRHPYIPTHAARAGGRGDGWGAFFAMATEALRGNAARLHVSGDFVGPDGEVDWNYVRTLCRHARWIRRQLATMGEPDHKAIAYTYTHYRGVHAGVLVNDLRSAGIAVRRSGVHAADGAVTVPVGSPNAGVLPDGGRWVKCPAQYRPDFSCRDCGVCKQLKPRRAVAFEVHGNGARNATPSLGGLDR